MLMLLCTIAAQAQIVIGGNVYGGGSKGKVAGSTSVTVKAGDLKKVFGGARQAVVGGSSYVHIDGANATDYMVIDNVFGGNDIAGTIGTLATLNESLPDDEKETLPEEIVTNKDGVDLTWNSYVHLSTKLTSSAEYFTQADIDAAKPGDPAYGKTTGHVKTPAVPADDNRKIFIGQAFAGGNGAYTYTDDEGNPLKDDKGNYIVKMGEETIATSKSEFILPELNKAYLDIQGGTIDYAYGGGNNVTVKEKTIIHVDNPSKVVTNVLVNEAGVEADETIYEAYKTNGANGTYENNGVTYRDLLSEERLKEMGINTFFSSIESDAFQIGRLFGGNNLAEMDIMPSWNLQSGLVRNLYSGGNKGKMTCWKGLLLEIPETSNIVVDNVYGGCRMADVMPLVNGVYTPTKNADLGGGYKFPDELAARVLIHGGDINNVYGGNDVTGTVYGGNAIGIYTTIRGDVYGGGNGAYPYTNLIDDETYGDLFYGKETDINDLNAYRPNAEQVSIRLKGKGPGDFTIVKGAVYLGGNCATLDTKKDKALVELKIGSYVIADKVFLGNNGEKMVDEDYLKLYAGKVDANDKYTEDEEGEGIRDFSSLDLTDVNTFAGYMEGVTMNLKPNIVFDKKTNGDPDDYLDNTSYIGSLYCGGNRGSMSFPGKNTYTIDRGINIFEKFVGGCNNADVEAGTYNAAYEGGILGSAEERTVTSDQRYTNYSELVNGKRKIKDRLQIDLANLTITPLRWNDSKTRLIWNTNKWFDYTLIEAGTKLEVNDVYYTYDETTKVYSSHTVTSTHTVGSEDKFYEKVDDFLPVGNIPFNETSYKPEDYKDVRLLGGNVYGGCYTSGHVNGNVTINIDEDVLRRDDVFGTGTSTLFGGQKSGVELIDQRDDVMALALTVFGAGYGKETEIWGSTTVNLNKGYALQIFGGGEQGVVGKKVNQYDSHNQLTGKEYEFDSAYSTTVNLNSNSTVSYSDKRDDDPDDLAETEYIYGGGNEGLICGNSSVNLGNGRIYDAFGGSSNADILGHSEVYIGRQINKTGGYKDGFPWICDIVYGGNDFGGTIFGQYDEDFDFTSRIRDYANDKSKIYGYKAGKVPEVLKSASYVEYLQGRVDTIFGGSYGFYDYTLEKYKDDEGKVPDPPYLSSSFVNIRPNTNGNNAITSIFGGGTGFPGYRKGDKSQDRSYVLIDIPDGVEKFKTTKVFGSGSYNGLGMRFDVADTFKEGFDRDNLSAVIDLIHGKIGTAYGGSYNEGVTARTMVNVPNGSTINIQDIFGGAYGTQILPPCDVYESIVNYHSNDATVNGTIYGGNNNERRTLYAKVNISSPVWSNKSKGYTAKVFGAGRGIDTWAEYTEVNLLPKRDGDVGDYTGGMVYEVYGGGEMGHVLNAESVQKYMQMYKEGPSPQIGSQDPYWKNHKDDLSSTVPEVQASAKARWAADWKDAWTLGDYFVPTAKDNEKLAYTDYVANTYTNLDNTAIVTTEKLNERIDDRDYTGMSDSEKAKRYKKYNTNVHIYQGATVAGYAYGGGLGDAGTALSGDTYGTTYIALLGGTVEKDLYAAGTTGAVYDLFGVKDFIASSNAYIKGGSARNVYGGGWKGNVGTHTGGISTDPTNDILGETHVVIGEVGADSTFATMPVVQRNVYAGGEGGSIYGTANLKINNGFIGYLFENTSGKTYKYFKDHYVENITENDEGDLEGSGNAFGGGYVVNSYVDKTNVEMYGGIIRGSLYGGGELGPIGRGTKLTVNQNENENENGWKPLKNGEATIYKPGHTLVKMFNGHVKRNVFGGGRGKDSWGGDGTQYMDAATKATLDLSSKGNIFGQTEVRIHGGEVGTVEEMTDATILEKNGNVFGGGDEGYVYSAYEENGKYFIGKKSGKRYNEGLTVDDDDYSFQGYYYKHRSDHDLTDADKTAIGYKEIDGQGFLRNEYDERYFTEDCKVLVEPWLEVTAANGIKYNADGDNVQETYAKGDYIPIGYLNTLPQKNPTDGTWTGGWANVDAGSATKERGVIIHNAVFAGGNIASGSMNANIATVFGNATASVNDVYNRDLITIGTGHTGGLYGDGNLTLVDGYRELNITNYGTDYYNINNENSRQITIEEYNLLPPREQAYYEVKYKCVAEGGCTDNAGTTYSAGSTLPEDELLALFAGRTDVIDPTGKPMESVWKQNGVVSIYAGRIMNTIQRSDFCGVFGSRMVMKGAPDRVPEELDYTNYTINRVREVSLNKKQDHGNYFGIYSIVNHLGALTSDVNFHTTKRTTNATDPDYQGNNETFYAWKEAHKTDRMRNNGTCHNLVALASGVYLEITTEESTGTDVDKKVWGPITGVIELDLINVQPGIGGGFVYAKNIHGVPKDMRSSRHSTTLTTLNNGAATQWDYDYIETNSSLTGNDAKQNEWETSGNFIHSSVSQPIIDDCYNISGKYELGKDPVPAHYWFIQGQVYVYDQYISAYTGSPNAFSETVEIPLTIAAASNGRMTLMNVQPNRYAYYSVNSGDTKTKLTSESKIVINDVEYKLNDPISYWDWYLLTPALQKLFVEQTYVTSSTCKTYDKDNNLQSYPAGYVMLPEEYTALQGKAVEVDLTPNDNKVNKVKAVVKVIKDEEGNEIVAEDADGNVVYVDFDDIFHSSNNISHENGYLLTYKVTNPKVWDQWYTKIKDDKLKDDNNEEITDEQGNPIYVQVMNQTGGAGFEDGPTYRVTKNGLYGQRDYKVSDIIPEDVYTTYQAVVTNHSGAIPTNDPNAAGYDKDLVQATFERAYITTDYVEATDQAGTEQHLQKGAKLAKSEYSTAEWNTLSSKVEEAYVCTSTIQLSDTEFIYPGDLMTESEKDALKVSADIKNLIVPAYYCTSTGKYGGDYYVTGTNYRARETWSSLSEKDRKNFEFNYDALDLLVDSKYGKLDNGTYQKEGKKYQYDGQSYDWSIPTDATDAEKKKMMDDMIYSLSKSVDYTATYYGDGQYTTVENDITVTHDGFEYTDANGETHYVDKDKDLNREDYESLPNEQRHYTAITVKPSDVDGKTHTVYVVKEGFVHGETPYAAGTTIEADKYSSLGDYQNYITQLTFKQSDLDKTVTTGEEGVEITTYNNTTFYYCRENYQVNENGMGENVTGLNISGATYSTESNTYTKGNTVPVGVVISSGNYGNLKNKQLYFSIHGKSPMETSTLYVSRNSDINDLSTEKIITVVYQYDYDESDASGLHITPISERHVMRIHITFKSGSPTVEDIRSPGIVLPGTSITLQAPKVTPGAYDVLSGGWELFENKTYAESHINGVEYTSSTDPLYWYQDGYYIAYYAKTYLGKTYSNFVPISVANYHDLKKVMDDKKHHLYVDYDRTRLKRDSKIYINDYSSSSENGLDLFKDFYDLSVYNVPANNLEDGLIKTGYFAGHKPLNNSIVEGKNIFDDKTYKKGVLAGENLDFFLRTDIDHGPITAPNPEHETDPTKPETIVTDTRLWTPIASGTSDPCFKGTLHGDGHTISGLNPAAGTSGSLFSNLCGAVYNLGVTGSFTGAGVADDGIGYVESCWVKTTGTPTKESGNHFAVLGNPSRTGNDLIQVVNCYYPSSNDYQVPADENHGKPIAMPDESFYNGEVAYNLNNFYLYKRYSNQNGTVDNDDRENRYFTIDANDELELQPYRKYENKPLLCSSGFVDENSKTINYVEDRFADGDYRFAGGEIVTDDQRHYVEDITEEDGKIKQESHYYPIWPDDYIFFGQRLTYGYASTHQDVPTAVTKSDGRLTQGTSANRVYRAPAYYRSKNMGVAYFNPDAYLAYKSADGTKTVSEEKMTAIDFAGHNAPEFTGSTYALGTVSATSGSAAGTTQFYPPLLDDDGLTAITNCDETPNLLVYAPAEDDNKATYDVLTSYFEDPSFTSYYDNTEGYRLVGDATGLTPKGHLVQSDLTATSDHLLVDKKDFNAPIRYTFASGKRMWYQRKPADKEYVDRTKGWQGISLPFTAELVTTHQKGEITHFFSGSAESANGTGTKVGHEYWLRRFTGINNNVNGNGNENQNVAKANFTYPDATGSVTMDKKRDDAVTNTFLWDYYYSNTDRKDANSDLYQEQDFYRKYYSEKRDYESYPLLTAATPYLMGMPGLTYYEFDLSGSFIPKNTATTIEKLDKQVITFASQTGATINVSDDEISYMLSAQNAYRPVHGNYAFVPSYMSQTLKAVQVDADGKRVEGDTTPKSFVINADGSAYNAVTWTKNGNEDVDENEKVVVVAAFRPYFIDEAAISNARQTRSILFSQLSSEDMWPQHPQSSQEPGSLSAHAGRRLITVSSTMNTTVSVRILNTAGQALATFDIEPGETVETRINISGVYVVQSADGKYTKKLSVR